MISGFEHARISNRSFSSFESSEPLPRSSILGFVERISLKYKTGNKPVVQHLWSAILCIFFYNSVAFFAVSYRLCTMTFIAKFKLNDQQFPSAQSYRYWKRCWGKKSPLKGQRMRRTSLFQWLPGRRQVSRFSERAMLGWEGRRDLLAPPS